MLHFALAASFAASLAVSPSPGAGAAFGHTVLLVTPPAPTTRQNETVAMQRLAAAIETRLGLRETAQDARAALDARVACPDGVDYVLRVDAATLRPMTTAKQLTPRLSATLTRCADRSEVYASRSADVPGIEQLNDPAVATAYRTLEPLVVDDVVARARPITARPAALARAHP